MEVVSIAAARQGMSNPIVLGEDHISICKPKSKSSEAYAHLKDYVQGRLKVTSSQAARVGRSS